MTKTGKPSYQWTNRRDALRAEFICKELARKAQRPVDGDFGPNGAIARLKIELNAIVKRNNR